MLYKNIQNIIKNIIKKYKLLYKYYTIKYYGTNITYCIHSIINIYKITLFYMFLFYL